MRAVRTARVLAGLALLTLSQSACDSAQPAETETDALIGTWAITGLVDGRGGRSDIISDGFEGVHLEFSEDGTSTFTITPKGHPATLFVSAYSLDEQVDLITMEFEVSTGSAKPLELTYVFEEAEQRARFHTPQSDVLNWMLGSELSGDVMIMASKFGDNGVPQ